MRLIPEISEKQMSWRNDPAIMQFTRQSKILTQRDMELWRDRISLDDTIQMFGIEIDVKGTDSYQPRSSKFEYKDTANAGTCGLTSISMIHRHAEWSLLIGPEYQGKGYGKAALKLLLEYGFNHLGLNRIWGEIFETNEKCLNMAEKMGFTREGKLRKSYFKEGTWINSIIVSMLCEEWDGRKQN